MKARTLSVHLLNDRQLERDKARSHQRWREENSQLTPDSYANGSDERRRVLAAPNIDDAATPPKKQVPSGKIFHRSLSVGGLRKTLIDGVKKDSTSFTMS